MLETLNAGSNLSETGLGAVQENTRWHCTYSYPSVKTDGKG
jgi:hypothetical protein